MIAARVFDHTVLERMAGAVEIPVVNLLSDLSHPLQAIADLLTIRAEFGPDLAGRTLTWVGDYSNVARSLGLRLRRCSGMKVRFSCPEAYQPPAEDLVRMAELGADWAEYDGDPQAAAEGTDVLVTDAWYSMGQEDEMAIRKPIFERYRVDQAMLDRAHRRRHLPALPARPPRRRGHRRGARRAPQSRVWPEAGNRLPAARGALEWLVIASEAGR